MVLKDDDSSIIVSGIKAVIGLAEIDRTISPSELVYNPLKPTNTLLGLKSLSAYSLDGARQAGRVGGGTIEVDQNPLHQVPPNFQSQNKCIRVRHRQLCKGRFGKGNNPVNESNATWGKTVINMCYKNTITWLTSGFGHHRAVKDCVYHRARARRW